MNIPETPAVSATAEPEMPAKIMLESMESSYTINRTVGFYGKTVVCAGTYRIMGRYAFLTAA